MASYTVTSDNDVYRYWTVTSDCTSTFTGTSVTDTAWRHWTSDSTSSGTSTLYDSTWTIWVEPSNNKIIYKYDEPVIQEAPLVITPKRTTEQERARRAQAEIDRIKIEEHKEKKRQAELTAQQLLEDLIEEEELARYKETGSLLVKGRKFDYVIDKTRGVWKVDKDKVIDLCVHLKQRYKYPETDNVISLKLLIEANEREFLKTANSHGEVYSESIKERVLKLVKEAA